MQEPYVETFPPLVSIELGVPPEAPVPARPVVPTEIEVRRFDELTDSQLADWSRFQQADPALEGPYFRPEFTRVVASVRGNVEVALLLEEGRTVGFFPFERRGRCVARPVGGPLSDYQGVIGCRGLSWDAAALVRGCGLAAWNFDHLLASQGPFEPYHQQSSLSPYLDLSEGFETYRASLRKSGLNELRQTLRKGRKMDREVGPLRFEPESKDPEMLATMIRWKSDQYRRTGVTDVFAFPWTTRVLQQILQEDGPSFRGVLSVLHAGDKPVSIHMGMQSGGCLHWWFPAYDPEFAVFSPGRILLAQMAQEAQSLGVRKIDLGHGAEPYKQRAMSGAVAVAEGSVELRPLARIFRQCWRNTRDWVRSSPLRGPAGVPNRLLHRFRRWLAFQ